MVRPVRVTAAGTWFSAPDGGAGSLLRLAEGRSAEQVRRIRDVGLPGLLPIGNVVAERDGVWLRTPQPSGPTLDDLLTPTPDGLGTADAVAVVRGVGHTLRALHSRGWCHGRVDGGAVLVDPDGAPLLVMVAPGRDGAQCDVEGLAGLAQVLADAWCDEAGAALLRRCAALATASGLEAALAILPRPAAGSAQHRRAVARSWTACLREGSARVDEPGESGAVPGPRTGGEHSASATT